MTTRDGGRPHWPFFDGAVSISVSMWCAIALHECSPCSWWPALGLLSGLAANETGVIIVGTALLFPTATVLYGGSLVILAAIDTYSKWTQAREAKAKAREEKAIARGREEGREAGREEGREAGREEGREEGRNEIVALLQEHDVQLPQEVLSKLNGDAE